MQKKDGDILKDGTRRIYMLDELRGFAILCMVVHHIFLSIGDVLGLEWGYLIFEALCIVQPVFWAIFILISGVCSRLSRNTVKRGLVVFACGLLITAVTVGIMPLLGMEGAQIYFGVLSCLGACMIITGLLMPVIEKTNEKLGMAISAVLFFFTYGISERTLLFGIIKLPDILYQNDWFSPLGFHTEYFYSADYFALIPWLFMFLFGAFLGKIAKEERLPEIMYNRHSKFLCLTGKHSLWIYLGHQVVIYGILYLIGFIYFMFSHSGT